MKLTTKTAQEIIDRYSAGEMRDTLAKEFNIAKSTISMLLNGHIWPSLSRPNNLNDVKTLHMTKKITFDEAQSIVDRYIAGESSNSIASAFGLSTYHVTLILHGEVWKSLQRPSNINEIIKQRKYWCYKHRNLPPLTNHQNNLIIGSLLGDAWLSKVKGPKNVKFSKQQKLPDHITWLSKELQPYTKKVYTPTSRNKMVSTYSPDEGVQIKFEKTKKHKVGYCLYTIAHPVFTDLRNKWYPNDVKSIPPDLILNPEMLAIWFIDDGSNSYKNRQAYIATNGFTFEEAEFLVERLKKDVSIESKVGKCKGLHDYKPIIRFGGDNYDNLIKTIKPYVIWKSYLYKIKHRERQLKNWRRVTPEQKIIINQLYVNGKSISEISRLRNITRNTVSKIVHQKSFS